MSDLVLNKAERHLILYREMCSAIGTCHRIDECKDIADKSVALAAYYKQIKDDETVQKFYEVRLRAWRRIGKLLQTVDTSKCDTYVAKFKLIRAAFDEDAMHEIGDGRLREILDLMTLTDSDFETAIGHELTTGSIGELIRLSPFFQEQSRRRQAAWKTEPPTPPTSEQIKQGQKIEQDAAREKRHLGELLLASDAAMKEVGLTLERKDRARLKSVVFLIKDEIHKMMRQAAFDRKITMQEILRRGLKMWLIAHDYEFPDD
jgi:hypothetical protein